MNYKMIFYVFVLQMYYIMLLIQLSLSEKVIVNDYNSK